MCCANAKLERIESKIKIFFNLIFYLIYIISVRMPDRSSLFQFEEFGILNEAPASWTNKIHRAFKRAASMVIHPCLIIPKRNRIAAFAQHFAIFNYCPRTGAVNGKCMRTDFRLVIFNRKIFMHNILLLILILLLLLLLI